MQYIVYMYSECVGSQWVCLAVFISSLICFPLLYIFSLLLAIHVHVQFVCVCTQCMWTHFVLIDGAVIIPD